MGFVEDILRFLGGEILVKRIVNPLLRDPSYQSGFIWGLATAGVFVIVKFFFDRFVYWWKRILQFFQPTKGPADPSKGPSPFRMFLQFVVSLVSVVLIVLLVAGIIFMIWRTM